MSELQSYDVVQRTPSVEDYLRIRREAGLSAKSHEAATKGLPNSLFAVSVLHQGDVVGMGRVIGDGGCFYQVVDIAVVPAHQGRGLGRRIMQQIMGFIEESALPGTYVSLIANDGAFYVPFGFSSVSPPDDGMCLRFPAERDA